MVGHQGSLQLVGQDNAMKTMKTHMANDGGVHRVCGHGGHEGVGSPLCLQVLFADKKGPVMRKK